METNKLHINCSIQIQKPIQEVFEAIVNPTHMTQYFISSSSGKMESYKELIWEFPEFDFKCPIKVKEVKENSYISYTWDNESIETFVEISLLTKENDSTLVTVSEKSRDYNEAGIKWLSGNAFGWSNFLACLKAYLEYNINLRKGAFDFLRKENQCS